MKILLTGATGFVGGHLYRALSDKDVTCLLRRKQSVFEKEVILPSFDADSDFSAAVKGKEVIIHTAAQTHSMEGRQYPLTTYRNVNTLGTLRFAKQALDAGVKRFIFISSVKVNGECSHLNEPFKPSDPHSPLSDYGVSKSEAELQLLSLARGTNMEVVIIRPTLIYGPGVKANFASLMNLVSKGVPLPFGCIKNNKRSLVSVDNLVDLIITCIDHSNAANQVFLVSDDHDVSTSEMVRQMAQALGKPTWQLPVPVWCYKLAGKVFNKSDVADRLTSSLQVNISHTKETLDWVPPQSLQEGFKQTAEAFLQSKKSSGKV